MKLALLPLETYSQSLCTVYTTIALNNCCAVSDINRAVRKMNQRYVQLSHNRWYCISSLYEQDSLSKMCAKMLNLNPYHCSLVLLSHVTIAIALIIMHILILLLCIWYNHCRTTTNHDL